MADSTAYIMFEHVVQRFEPQSKLLRTWELKGGVSAQVTAIEIERPDGYKHKMIVRQHGEVDLKHNPYIAADEFKLLQLLHSVGLAVPEPYYLDQSGEIFPTPYVVIEYIEGETLFGPKNAIEDVSQIEDLSDPVALGDAGIPTQFPDTARPWYSNLSLAFRAPGRRWHNKGRLEKRAPGRRWFNMASRERRAPGQRKRPHTTSTQPLSLQVKEPKPSVWVEPVVDFIPQLAMQLYRIHEVDCAKLDVSFLPLKEKRVAEKLGERPEKVDEAFEEGRIRDVLEEVWPLSQQNRSVLLHGDFWPGNILWRDGQIVGVIDWEDAALGDPLADIANSRLELLWAFGIDAMRKFTHHYQSLADIDFANLPYWELYAALRRISQIAEWGLDEITEKTMRERLRWFIAQAFMNL